MRVRRLGWAGLEIEAGGERMVIDYVRDLSPLFTGWKPGENVAVPGGRASAALVTHLHRESGHGAVNPAAVRTFCPAADRTSSMNAWPTSALGASLSRVIG